MTSDKQTGSSESRHLLPVTSRFFGLPHRPPFVFVREIIARDPGVSAQCAMVFAAADPMFAGHFPGNPLVPGVILTEALAQTAGIAAAPADAKDAKPRWVTS